MPDADATPRQKFRIARMSRVLGVEDETEQARMSRGEAGRMIRLLAREIKLRRGVRRGFGHRIDDRKE